MDTDEVATALATAVERVGDRWTLRLVHALLAGPQRYSDLQRRLDGISPNVLSQRLSRLEEERVVVAAPYSQRPPRFSYELTAAGHRLADALHLLAAWASDQTDATVRHDVCGTPLDVRWWCPTCDRPAAVDDDLHHL